MHTDEVADHRQKISLGQRGCVGLAVCMNECGSLCRSMCIKVCACPLHACLHIQYVCKEEELGSYASAVCLY